MKVTIYTRSFRLKDSTHIFITNSSSQQTNLGSEQGSYNATIISLDTTIAGPPKEEQERKEKEAARSPPRSAE